MAKKKPRTPPPPRVQAPQTRQGRSSSAPGEITNRQRTILYAFAASGVVALVAVIAVFALGGSASGSTKSAVKTIINEGCQYKQYPALARAPHYTTLTPSPPPQWNSVPPTSGRHFVTPLIFNEYTQPVAEIQAVHNLEHGAVILQYGNKIPQAQIDSITAWYRKDPNAIIVAPLPSLGDKVALTAWTYWAECTGFDLKAANAFKTFRYRAPEKFPKSYLNPGE